MTNLKMSPLASLVIILSLILSGIDFLTCLPASHSPRIPQPQPSRYSPPKSTPTSANLAASLIPLGVLQLTNVKRQIGNSSGNPIWNLHTKVNGQGERGGQRLNVTDVSPSSEFTTTTFKRSKDVLQEHPLDPRDLNSTSQPSSPNTNINRSSSRSGVNVTKDPDDTESTTTSPRMLITYNGIYDAPHSFLQRKSQSGKPGLQTIVVNEVSTYSEGNGTDLKGQGRPCLPVIVNQTLSRNNTDMDKWARGLVKITQCVANCLRTLFPPSPRLKLNKYVKMTSKKGMDGIAGSALPPGISSHVPRSPAHPHNGDVMKIMKHNLNDKMLSSCQKTCKFLPRKSTTTPRNPTMKKALVIERNKVGEEMKRIPIPVTSIPIPVKPDDSSGLEITPSDTGVFHLQWPEISSPTSNKMPVVYTVILLNDIEGFGRWKLIDQTVAQETQISLVADVCQENRTKNSTPTASATGRHDHNIIRVFAVSSQGLEKVFTAYLSCCQEIHEDSSSRQPFIRSQPVVDKNAKNTGISNRTRPGSNIRVNRTLGLGNEALKPANPPTHSLSWGLHTVSMVYENFLVVTEVSWAVPGEPSNHEEGVTRDRSGDEMKNQKYNFLLTWEIFGGGLRGNLVTDTTTGTISLWPDTAYFIQVGLINTESPDLSTSSKTNNSSNSSSKAKVQNEEDKQEENYMNTNLSLESIIFPLTEGEPSVTIKSERLFVNTSQLSILSSSSSSSPSSSSSGSSGKSDSKSNNPLLHKEQGKSFYLGQSKNVSSIQTRVRPRTSEVTTSTSIPTKISNSTTSSGNSSSSSLVSRIGNDQRRNDDYGNGHGYLGDSPQASKYYEEGEVAPPLAHSYRDTLRKNSTSGTNGYEDKKRNINDNKSNNNLKPKPSPKPSTAKSPTDHNHVIHGMFSRPDVYQSLFALDSETSLEDNMAPDGDSSGGNNKGERPSVVYSVFVLVIVACVIFIFLVSFIGFFVVSSSISSTAQYFVPKRVRIWVVGETELLRGDQQEDNDEEDELEYRRCHRDVEDLEDDENEDEEAGIGRDEHIVCNLNSHTSRITAMIS